MNPRCLPNISKALFLIVSLCFNQNLNAQKKIQPEFSVQYGIGVFPTYIADGGNSLLPPISLTGTIQFQKKVSFSAEFGYSIQNASRIFQKRLLDWKNHSSFFLLKSAVHYDKLETIDIYGGLVIGVNQTKVKSQTLELIDLEHLGIKSKQTRLIYTAFIGYNYYWNKHLFFFGEAGFMISLLKLGIGYKI